MATAEAVAKDLARAIIGMIKLMYNNTLAKRFYRTLFGELYKDVKKRKLDLSLPQPPIMDQKKLKLK